MGERCVYKVTIADRPGNGGGTEVDLTAPVMLCDEFNAKYVTFSKIVGNVLLITFHSKSLIRPDQINLLLLGLFLLKNGPTDRKK